MVRPHSHTMKTAKNLFILLLIALIPLGYAIGYLTGKQDDERELLALNLDKDVNLYQKAENGDLAGVKSQLGFFILGQFNVYERHFGDEHFLHFDDARRIATLAATNGDVIGFRK